MSEAQGTGDSEILASGQADATQAHIRSRRYSRVIHAVLFFTFCLAAVIGPVQYSLQFERFGFAKAGASIGIQDFASHMTFVRRVLRGEVAPGSSVYSVDFQLANTRELAGEDVPLALPFGYSPTMVAVLAPLAGLPSTRASYLAWVLISMALVFWMTRPARGNAGLGILCFFGPIAMGNLVLGQFSIAATAVLLCLFLACRKGLDTRSGVVVAALCMWALTAKPPLALMAGAFLVSLRAWKPIILALGLTLVSTLVLTPWLGATWIEDYLVLASGYNSSQTSAAYAWSLVPELMNGVAAWLVADLGVPEVLVFRSIGVLWLAVLAALAWSRPCTDMFAAAALFLLTNLMLFPHQYAHELMLLYLFVPLVATERETLVGSLKQPLIWIVPFVMLVVPSLQNPTPGRSVLLILGLVLAVHILSRRELASAPSRAQGCC